VIVWTSSEDPLLINECKDSKADAVIVKPTDFEGYVAMIQRVLSDYLR
jgi:AmiR/NasT family two-component response regulator